MIDLLFPKNINCIFCSLPIHEENYLSLCKKCYQKLKFLEEICIRCGRSGKGRTLSFSIISVLILARAP